MKMKLHRTQNDLPEKTRKEIVVLLNQQLADVLDLGLQIKQAHWNVKGPHFIGLHELFDKVADELQEFTDEIAERAVQLDTAAKTGDADTADLFTEISRGVDKLLWMVEAHAQAKE